MITYALKRYSMRASCFCGSILLLQLTAGAQTAIQFASGLGTPNAGAALTGTALNPSTSQPVRHLWPGDNDNGLCRLDPDVDTPRSHAINCEFSVSLHEFRWA